MKREILHSLLQSPMPVNAEAGSGQNQEPEASVTSPMWVAQTLAPSLTAFPKPLARSWVKSGVAGA